MPAPLEVKLSQLPVQRRIWDDPPVEIPQSAYFKQVSDAQKTMRGRSLAGPGTYVLPK
jgi:hypothetical protein